MRRSISIAALGAVLALAACDQPKPRHLPPDPMAKTPPQPVSAAAPAEALPAASAGLAQRPGAALFSIDSIGEAVDPYAHQPAIVAGGAPILIRGFGFDPVAKAPGKGLDIVVDGKPYRTAYGAGRDDVAAYFKNPAVTATGYAVTLPAGALAAGPHKANVRVVSVDGTGFYDGVSIPFEIR